MKPERIQMPEKVLLWDFDQVLLRRQTHEDAERRRRHELYEKEVWHDDERVSAALRGDIPLRDVVKAHYLALGLTWASDDIVQDMCEIGTDLNGLDNDLVEHIKFLRNTHNVRNYLVTDQTHARWEYLSKFFGGLFYNLFDYYFPSCHVGATKREAAFFERVMQKLEIQPENCFFIDDRAENNKVASDLGMNTFLYNEKRKNLLKFQVNGFLEI